MCTVSRCICTAFMMELSRHVTVSADIFILLHLLDVQIARPALLLRAHDRFGTDGDIRADRCDIFHLDLLASAFQGGRGGACMGRHACGCDVSSLLRARTGRTSYCFWQLIYRFIVFSPLAVCFSRGISQLLWVL